MPAATRFLKGTCDDEIILRNEPNAAADDRRDVKDQVADRRPAAGRETENERSPTGEPVRRRIDRYLELHLTEIDRRGVRNCGSAG